jgi:hypothetical protein
VWQAVCSPFRNPLAAHERAMIRLGGSRFSFAVGRALARSAGVRDPSVRWRTVEGPYFDNQVATLTLDGRRAQLVLERTLPDDGALHECFRRRLA